MTSSELPSTQIIPPLDATHPVFGLTSLSRSRPFVHSFAFGNPTSVFLISPDLLSLASLPLNLCACTILDSLLHLVVRRILFPNYRCCPARCHIGRVFTRLLVAVPCPFLFSPAFMGCHFTSPACPPFFSGPYPLAFYQSHVITIPFVPHCTLPFISFPRQPRDLGLLLFPILARLLSLFDVPYGPSPSFSARLARSLVSFAPFHGRTTTSPVLPFFVRVPPCSCIQVVRALVALRLEPRFSSLTTFCSTSFFLAPFVQTASPL